MVISRERLISFPRKVTVGEKTVTLPPLSESDKKERVAFSRAVMFTKQFKRLKERGVTKHKAIQIAGEQVSVRKGKKWFSVSRLPGRLQTTAKKFWRK